MSDSRAAAGPAAEAWAPAGVDTSPRRSRPPLRGPRSVPPSTQPASCPPRCRAFDAPTSLAITRPAGGEQRRVCGPDAAAGAHHDRDPRFDGTAQLRVDLPR